MATGDQFDLVYPQRLSCPVGPGTTPPLMTFGGPVIGVPLAKGDPATYDFSFRVWSNGTPLPTGLTFVLELYDDPIMSGLGLVVVLGIACKRIVSGTTVGDLTSYGTEVTANCTMPAAAGVMKTQALVVANANLTSLAAGDWCHARVRRLGSNAADTHPGRVGLTAISVRDT